MCAQNMRELTSPEAKTFIFSSFSRHIENSLTCASNSAIEIILWCLGAPFQSKSQKAISYQPMKGERQ
jgi:hypothetical protein